MCQPETADNGQAQCQVFATTFNPEGVRMGNKVLRQRLKGPAVAAYYPRKIATIKDVKREFGPVLATWDDAEEDRFEYIEEYDDGTSRERSMATKLTRAQQAQAKREKRTQEEERPPRYISCE